MVGSKALVHGIEFGSIASQYVDPGTYDLSLLPFRKTDTTLLAVKGVALEGDTQYYLLAVNTVDKIEPLLLTGVKR